MGYGDFSTLKPFFARFCGFDSAATPSPNTTCLQGILQTGFSDPPPPQVPQERGFFRAVTQTKTVTCRGSVIPDAFSCCLCGAEWRYSCQTEDKALEDGFKQSTPVPTFIWVAFGNHLAIVGRWNSIRRTMSKSRNRGGNGGEANLNLWVTKPHRGMFAQCKGRVQ